MGLTHDIKKPTENRDNFSAVAEKIGNIYYDTRTEFTCMHVLFLIQKFQFI